MQVILKESIESLGMAGTEVKVSDGYARNYLFPQNKAVEATPANRKIMEQNRQKLELQIAREKEAAMEAAGKLAGVVCRVMAKAGPEGRLYGSVTASDISAALKDQGIDVSKRMLLIREPIKEIGTFTIAINLYKDIHPEITVEVVKEEDEA
ncbi:MAG: 50S ribosomal protein L9 [Thermodesulfobacteriota bacterium]